MIKTHLSQMRESADLPSKDSLMFPAVVSFNL